MAQTGKNLPANVGDVGSMPGCVRSSGEGPGNPLLIFDWKIPWTEESDGLQSVESQRVRPHWVAEHAALAPLRHCGLWRQRVWPILNDPNSHYLLSSHVWQLPDLGIYQDSLDYATGTNKSLNSVVSNNKVLLVCSCCTNVCNKPSPI